MNCVAKGVLVYVRQVIIPILNSSCLYDKQNKNPFLSIACIMHSEKRIFLSTTNQVKMYSIDGIRSQRVNMHDKVFKLQNNNAMENLV